MKRLLALIVCGLFVWVGAAHGQSDNTAIAVNTKDGSSLFKLSFRITRVMGDTVDTGNAAVAYASCTDCQTTALALQFVLVMSEPDVFTPENLALAMNVDCSLCDTLASAYQFVLQSDGPVHLTPDGKKRLQEIRKELAALKDSGLGSFELQAKVDALAEEAYQVMATSLVPAGKSSVPTTSEPSSTSTSTTSTSTSTSTTTSSTSTTTTSTTAP
jgi:putative peptide zinc metalloprotease protein